MMRQSIPSKKLTGFELKLAACGSMLIDHAAVCLCVCGVPGFGQSDPVYLLMRCAGRLAFPIFCFLLVEGFYHTRSVAKYALRLFAGALLSEAPFDYLLFGENTGAWPEHQNAYFTLLAGLLMLFALNRLARLFSERKLYYNVSGLLLILVLGLAASACGLDYGFAGILVIAGFYYFRGNSRKLALYFAAVTLITGTVLQYAAILVLPLLLSYNGERGRRAGIGFYAFYPAHLAVFCVLRYVLLR